jgi:hypothetical protein
MQIITQVLSTINQWYGCMSHTSVAGTIGNRPPFNAPHFAEWHHLGLGWWKMSPLATIVILHFETAAALPGTAIIIDRAPQISELAYYCSCFQQAYCIEEPVGSKHNSVLYRNSIGIISLNLDYAMRPVLVLCAPNHLPVYQDLYVNSNARRARSEADSVVKQEPLSTPPTLLLSPLISEQQPSRRANQWPPQT